MGQKQKQTDRGNKDYSVSVKESIAEIQLEAILALGTVASWRQGVGRTKLGGERLKGDGGDMGKGP